MDIKKEYERWLENATADANVAAELKTLDNAKIEDAFYRDLAFGTGGLRGVIGAGTNRMNIYTVAKASQGLADYLKKNFAEPSVAIGYDSRIKSDVFAKVAAGVFAANGVKVNIWPVLMPVPTVSFATRYLHTSAGVMVTASHNPSKYNGYKVYGADGCQITTEAAAEILAEIEKLDIFADVKHSNFETGLVNGSIQYIPDEVYTAFVNEVKNQSVLFGEEVNLLLETKKSFIGKNVAWDSFLSAFSFLISVLLASYRDFFGLPGIALKTVFVVLGVGFTFKSLADIHDSSKNNYSYSDLLSDINKLNEITHNHSIVIIKDTFNRYPNRLLVYDDTRWNCKFFLNYAKRKNLLMGSNPIIAPDSEMLWNAAIVWRILRRYEYTGALVMGRRKKIDVNTTSVRTLPEDKWIIAENAHAAIVTKDEYYQAQKAIRNVTPIQYKVGDDFALKGKICCGNCNRQLRHERQYGEMVFCCGHKRSAGKFSKCYGGYYREYSVNAKVARAIKTVFYALDVVNQGMQEKQSITVRCMDIEDLEKQAEAIRVEQIKLYESYADGVLRRDVYIEKKKTLSEKLAALQDSIRTEKEEQECADELDEEIRALTKQASEKTYIGGLTKECVDAFVSMVYLYDDQTMKIEFNCEDVIRRALEKYGA